MVVQLDQIDQKTKSLYETDYHLWVLQTVKQLKERQFSALDLENLIEEVADLSRRDRHKLASLLMRLLEHLLKLAYWQSEKARNQNHWKGEIRNFRIQIKRLLQDSPSLNAYLVEILEECYQNSCRIVADKSGLSAKSFPETPFVTLDQLLDEDWLPS